MNHYLWPAWATIRAKAVAVTTVPSTAQTIVDKVEIYDASPSLATSNYT